MIDIISMGIQSLITGILISLIMNKQIIQSNLIDELKERAKELNCLYEIQELLNDNNKNIKTILSGIIKAIPPGWQYPDVCVTRIVLNDRTFESPDFVETEWGLTTDIVVTGIVVGSISVFYTEEMPQWDNGPFLKEKHKI